MIWNINFQTTPYKWISVILTKFLIFIRSCYIRKKIKYSKKIKTQIKKNQFWTKNMLVKQIIFQKKIFTSKAVKGIIPGQPFSGHACFRKKITPIMKDTLLFGRLQLPIKNIFQLPSLNKVLTSSHIFLQFSSSTNVMKICRTLNRN